MSTNPPYTQPIFNQNGFNCPFCAAFTQQDWGQVRRTVSGFDEGQGEEFKIARCRRCKRYSIWINHRMVYPGFVTAPEPNPDLSEEVKIDFEEARKILGDSPRGAAALLRLAIQKTCKELGEKGDNINADIASLVQKGLPVRVQQALDTVRVVGNNAVHPGQIDIRDNTDVALKLFGLVNLIADVMISQPKHVAALYNAIVPEDARKAIEQRDSSASA